EWSDSRVMNYTNWDENAVKDGIDGCVQMWTSGVNRGKWMDDNCNKKHLAICQKKQHHNWSLEKQLRNLTKVIEYLKEKDKNNLAIFQKLHQDNLSLRKQFNNLQDQFENQTSLHKQQMLNLTKANHDLGDQVDNQTSLMNKIDRDVQSAVPVGFVYTQLP